MQEPQTVEILTPSCRVILLGAPDQRIDQLDQVAPKPEVPKPRPYELPAALDQSEQ